MKDEDKTKEQLIREITELRQSVTTIGDNNIVLNGFNQIVEKLLMPISIKDADGHYLFINYEFEKLFAISPEEILGKTDFDLLSAEVAEKYHLQDSEVLETGNSFIGEETLSWKDNIKHFILTKSALYGLDGKPNAVCVSSIDITERKRAEEALEKSEERYRQLVELSPNGIVVYNEGKIVFINPAGIMLSGATNLDQLIGKSAIDFVHPDNREVVTKKFREMVEKKTITQPIEEKFIRLDGSEIDVEVVSAPLTYQGKPAIQIIIKNISKRKQLEFQLLQSQKMEAIGLLAGGIAHEFNNLLTPILGYTEMLMENKSEDHPDREGLDQILTAGIRAKNLVRQMLAYGRQSMSKRESVQLETLVESTIELIKNTISTGISIKKEIEMNLPPIFGMTNEIHQVILNLCINANYAMTGGGELTIRLKNVGIRKFIGSDGQQKEGKFISLSVQDTGSGMDQITLDRIFDPFFTTKSVGQGSGLGLSVVQGIVEQHEGHIDVESKIGKGTTFHIYFPILHEEVKQPIVKTESLFQDNERILLIDDESMVTSLTKRMLGKLGYKVTDFIDCVEALKHFTVHPQDFDLVITDYGMKKMNGKQMAEQLKKIRPEIPIILFTGYGDLIAREDIHTWGLDGLLMKPFKLKELSAAVREVLKES